VVVDVFLTSSTTVFLNHLAEASQIQTCEFVREPHKNILPQNNWHVYCTNEVLYKKY